MMQKLGLKCGTVISLSDLEDAGLSYVPCGTVNGHDQPLLSYAHLWDTRRPVTLKDYGKEANAWHLRHATGVQIMTGRPTHIRCEDSPDGYAYLTDIDIERLLIDTEGNNVQRIINAYHDACDGTPCIINTKSDGRRLSAYAPYLDNKREFHNSDQKMLMEIFSKKGLSRLDNRYTMIEGSILNLPTIPKSALEDIHNIISEVAVEKTRGTSTRKIVETSQIDNLEIEWDQHGKSQYFPASICPLITHTKNPQHPTIRFQRTSTGGIDGYCFNCQESWKEIEHDTPSRRIIPPEPVTTLLPDDPLISSAPAVESIYEQPSYRHFSPEAKVVATEFLGVSSDAGWHGHTPVWTTRYEYLHPLTNKFALNGQPSEVEKYRVWCTLFDHCTECGGEVAKWIDRYMLTVGGYCNDCHKDYPIGSYLEYELNRKLPNSIISEHEGFLGNDPEFADFRLFEPNMLTYMGSGMSTGKTTEVFKQLIQLAEQGFGKGVIVAPNVAFARFLAHQLRKKHGTGAWGLWHEGVRRDDRVIGKYGAIACLPSLPGVVRYAEENGDCDLYIAIDEIDFSYNLFSLSVDQATAVKKSLRHYLNRAGLVVIGQTETALALEAVTEELHAENVQGFYSIPSKADGQVVMHKHANEKNKSSHMLEDVLEDIGSLLFEGHNVYAFTSTRRETELIADRFSYLDPVQYTSYHKGTPRADAVLRNQKLTDTSFFVATSAAGIGLSILDEKARTVVLTGLKYGSRDASMVVQECVRDRGRKGVSLHYTDYNLSLPISPTETNKTNLYQESVKQILNNDAHIPKESVKKFAAAQALLSLADTQFETYMTHHLSNTANMEVSVLSMPPPYEEKGKDVALKMAELRNEEKLRKVDKAIQILDDWDIRTSREIRIESNQGKLSPDDRLAHEAANEAAVAVGWDDKVHGYDEKGAIRNELDPDDTEIAIRLVEKNTNTETLIKQRRGYIARHFPKWMLRNLESKLNDTTLEHKESGTGLESPAIDDDRFVGELLSVVIQALEGEVFNAESLANTMKEILQQTCFTSKSFIAELQAGILGSSMYRKSRFLGFIDKSGDVKWSLNNKGFVNWVSDVVSTWYPARIARQGETENDDEEYDAEENENALYALQLASHYELRLESFHRWLLNHPNTLEDDTFEMDICQHTEFVDKNAELKEKARERRQAGEKIKNIAQDLGVHPQTVGNWCKGIKPLSPTQQNVLDILGDGEVWKKADIEAHSRFAGQNVRIAIKALLEVDKVSKPKRGYYQKNGG